MISIPRATCFRVLALAGMAGAVALVSNFLASPARRLAWGRSGPALPPIPTSTERQPQPTPAPPQPGVQPSIEDHPRRPAPRQGSKIAAPPSSSARETPVHATSGPIQEISSQEAWAAFQSGAPFLDARRSAEFAEGHIARAWSTPVWESDVDDRLITFKAARRPGPEDPIVIYCSGGDCRDSHLLATKLLNEGYFHLLIYRDGFPAWVALGHPVEKGQP
jgi:rhodanese-related sulfurtransferase